MTTVILGIIFLTVIYLSFGAQVVEAEHDEGFLIQKMSKCIHIKPRMLYIMLCILWMPVLIVVIMYSLVTGAINCIVKSFVSLWKIINEKNDD